MKINVGTTNKGKIEAVQRACDIYEFLKGSLVNGVAVESSVSAQPIGLDEIIVGAQNRAKAAFESGVCDLAFGLESGIFPAPHTKSDYFDTCACVIYDGKNFHLGLSSCFEYPPKMIDLVLKDGKEITEAALELGFSHDEKFREGLGMIGTLTHGKITRVDYTLQSIQTALIHLENSQHYPSK